MKIVISGGHLTPALAFIDDVQTQEPEHQLLFVGREYSQEKLKQKSQEKQHILQRGIPFIALSAPRSPQTIIEFLVVVPQFLTAVITSLFIIIWHRPQLFLSFGGYVALPLAIASWICSVPIITHEQTRYPGSANRFIALLAQTVAISFPETASFFPEDKLKLTGNPLRPGLFKNQPRPDWTKHFDAKKPLLLITGGNQGSYIINTIVEQVLDKITRDWNVIHACGNKTSTTNYLKILEKARAKLKPSQRDSYVVREWISTEELGWIYHNQAVMISRAGANTVQEATSFRIPTIFVPLPTAKFDEQLHNARALTDKNAGILLLQKDLNAQTLLESLRLITQKKKTFKKGLDSFSINTNAAAELLKLSKQVIAEY